MKGLRDRAILALLLGCGLRRAEAASLTFDHIQQRDGRWVLVDLLGKRNKLRSVPMPAWTKAAIDEYAADAGLREGNVFRPINKGGRVTGDRMTEQAIYNVVLCYAVKLASERLLLTICDALSPSWHTRAALDWIRSSYRLGTDRFKRLSGILE